MRRGHSFAADDLLVVWDGNVVLLWRGWLSAEARNIEQVRDWTGADPFIQLNDDQEQAFSARFPKWHITKYIDTALIPFALAYLSASQIRQVTFRLVGLPSAGAGGICFGQDVGLPASMSC